MNARIFVWQPKAKDNKQKFESIFKVDYLPGVEGEFPIRIADVHKLANQGISYPYGAYAETDIPAGALISEYTGLPGQGLAKDETFIFRKDFNLPDYIDAMKAGSVARFINHSDTHNCAYMVEHGKLMVRAIRLIKAGEQLLANYGQRYWIGIKKIYLKPSDNWLSPEDKFHEEKGHYDELKSSELDVAAKKTLPMLLDVADINLILVPKFKYAHLPILVRQAYNKMAESQRELTLVDLYCYQGNFKKVEKLLKLGANPFEQCGEGRTAVSYLMMGPSSEEDKLKILQLILDVSTPAAIYCSDIDKKSVLHYCIEGGFNECLKLIIKSIKFDPRQLDNDMPSLLAYAITKNNVGAIDLISKQLMTKDMHDYINSSKEELRKAFKVTKVQDGALITIAGNGYDISRILELFSAESRESKSVKSNPGITQSKQSTLQTTESVQAPSKSKKNKVHRRDSIETERLDNDTIMASDENKEKSSPVTAQGWSLFDVFKRFKQGPTEPVTHFPKSHAPRQSALRIPPKSHPTQNKKASYHRKFGK